MINKNKFTLKNNEEIFDTLNKIREANYDFDISEKLLADLIEELQFWQDEQDIVYRKKFIEPAIDEEVEKKLANKKNVND